MVSAVFCGHLFLSLLFSSFEGFVAPDVFLGQGVLFLQRPPQLRRQFEGNLTRSLR